MMFSKWLIFCLFGFSTGLLQQKQDKSWLSWLKWEENEPECFIVQYVAMVTAQYHVFAAYAVDILTALLQNTQNALASFLNLTINFFTSFLSSSSMFMYNLWNAVAELSNHLIEYSIESISKIVYTSKNYPHFMILSSILLIIWIYLFKRYLVKLLCNKKPREQQLVVTGKKKSNSCKDCVVLQRNRHQVICFRLVISIALILFVVSIPWEFIRLYQQSVAEKSALIYQVIFYYASSKHFDFKQYSYAFITYIGNWHYILQIMHI